MDRWGSILRDPGVLARLVRSDSGSLRLDGWSHTWVSPSSMTGVLRLLPPRPHGRGLAVLPRPDRPCPLGTVRTEGVPLCVPRPAKLLEVAGGTFPENPFGGSH